MSNWVKRIMRRAGIIAGASVFAAGAAVLALGVAAAPAGANTLGGDNGLHGVGVSCDPRTHTITMTPSAATGSSFVNGQYIATKVWVRPENGTWKLMAQNTQLVRSITTQSSYFTGTYTINQPVNLYTTPATGSGYYQVGVEFWWWSGSAWTSYDFYVANSYSLPLTYYGVTSWTTGGRCYV